MTRGTILSRGTLTRLPRHHYVRCFLCGWRQVRTADTPDEACRRPCPRCGGTVQTS